MGRAPCCDKANVKKGPWSPEEDAKLKDYIEKHGTGGNWIALPQKVGLKRCGKSCRLRWLNYLRPNIKHGGFTDEEDNIICSLYLSIGSRWSIIAAQLPGRTDNDIKNYWNTKLKKKLLGKRKNLNKLCDEMKDIIGIDESHLSNSALERLQLHMQLQSLQNPLSLCNHPTLRPKLHGLQENMMTQNLYSSHENPNPFMHLRSQRDYQSISNPKVDELGNFVNENPSIAFSNGTNLLDSSTPVLNENGQEHTNEVVQIVELEDVVNSKEGGLLSQEARFAEFECLKDMNGFGDGFSWRANGLDEKCASTGSWNSTRVLLSEGMFQDFELDYNL